MAKFSAYMRGEKGASGDSIVLNVTEFSVPVNSNGMLESDMIKEIELWRISDGSSPEKLPINIITFTDSANRPITDNYISGTIVSDKATITFHTGNIPLESGKIHIKSNLYGSYSASWVRLQNEISDYKLLTNLSSIVFSCDEYGYSDSKQITITPTFLNNNKEVSGIAETYSVIKENEISSAALQTTHAKNSIDYFLVIPNEWEKGYVIGQSGYRITIPNTFNFNESSSSQLKIICNYYNNNYIKENLQTWYTQSITIPYSHAASGNSAYSIIVSPDFLPITTDYASKTYTQTRRGSVICYKGSEKWKCTSMEFEFRDGTGINVIQTPNVFSFVEPPTLFESSGDTNEYEYKVVTLSGKELTQSFRIFIKVTIPLEQGKPQTFTQYIPLEWIAVKSGAPANIELGDITTSTLAPNSNATVNVNVTPSADNTNNTFAFNFGIPQGITGPAAGFGTPTATVTPLNAGESPTVAVSAIQSSPNTAKEFAFTFGIPKGDTGAAAGFAMPIVNTDTTTWDKGASVSVLMDTNSPDTAKQFSYNFTVPTGRPAGFGTVTANVVGVDNDQPPTVSITPSGEDYSKNFVFDFTIPKGDTGENFHIEEYVDSVEQLESLPNPKKGYFYMVGANDLYTYTGEKWNEVGVITLGQTGPIGPTGPIGTAWVPLLSNDGTLNWSEVGTPTNGVNIKGEKGENGAVWIPYVDLNGELSWTKGDGKDEPVQNVSIIGPTGPTGPTGEVGEVWKPTVDQDGNLSWTLGGNGTPTSVNIKGERGETAGFSQPEINITMVDTDQNPSGTVTATGDDTAKKFTFNLSLPRGEQGETGPTGPMGSQFTVSTLSESEYAALGDNIDPNVFYLIVEE